MSVVVSATVSNRNTELAFNQGQVLRKDEQHVHATRLPSWSKII